MAFERSPILSRTCSGTPPQPPSSCGLVRRRHHHLFDIPFNRPAAFRVLAGATCFLHTSRLVSWTIVTDTDRRRRESKVDRFMNYLADLSDMETSAARQSWAVAAPTPRPALSRLSLRKSNVARRNGLTWLALLTLAVTAKPRTLQRPPVRRTDRVPPAPSASNVRHCQASASAPTARLSHTPGASLEQTPVGRASTHRLYNRIAHSGHALGRRAVLHHNDWERVRPSTAYRHPEAVYERHAPRRRPRSSSDHAAVPSARQSPSPSGAARHKTLAHRAGRASAVLIIRRVQVKQRQTQRRRRTQRIRLTDTLQIVARLRVRNR